MTTKPTTDNQVCRRQVWKYVLPADSIQNPTTIKLPRTFKIVHVDYQPNNGACIWIEVPVTDTYGPKQEDDLGSPNSQAHKHWLEASDEVFRVVPTGADIPVHQQSPSPRSDDPAPPLCSDPRWHDLIGGPAICPSCGQDKYRKSNPASVESRGRDYVHIGTAIDDFGFVWHVYWLTQLA